MTMNVATPTPLVVANWKMNLDGRRAVELAETIAAEPVCAGAVEVLLAPPFPYLERVGSRLRSRPVGLAAQNVHWEASGAFTGEVSAPMLADLGVSHVLIGHSERRRLFGEDDAAVRRKIEAACAAGLTPIVCVGEAEDERDAGRTEEVVRRQVQAARQATAWTRARAALVAYEPVWAIGTGRVARPAEVGAIHRLIRGLFPGPARVLYGGSVGPDSAADLMAEPQIDGLLVGSASLTADSFLAVVRAAAGSARLESGA